MTPEDRTREAIDRRLSRLEAEFGEFPVVEEDRDEESRTGGRVEPPAQ